MLCRSQMPRDHHSLQLYFLQPCSLAAWLQQLWLHHSSHLCSSTSWALASPALGLSPAVRLTSLGVLPVLSFPHICCPHVTVIPLISNFMSVVFLTFGPVSLKDVGGSTDDSSAFIGQGRVCRHVKNRANSPSRIPIPYLCSNLSQKAGSQL